MNRIPTYCSSALAAAVWFRGLCVGQAKDIPINIDLPKAGYVTVVIDDAQGNRARNLIAETLLPAGKTTLIWDGYDEGVRSAGGDDPCCAISRGSGWQ